MHPHPWIVIDFGFRAVVLLTSQRLRDSKFLRGSRIRNWPIHQGAGSKGNSRERGRERDTETQRGEQEDRKRNEKNI